MVLAVFIKAANDWISYRPFHGLKKILDSNTRFSVMRDGKLQELPLTELVVGDIAQFKYGSVLPVDGILIQVGVALLRN